MTAPAPKVGDRVLCRHGESKLVGTVASISAVTSVLRLDLAGCQQTIRWADWIVEVLRPPVPDVVGTIVRDRDGDPWKRDPDGWTGGGNTGWSLADLRDTYGELEVLYTPEDPA